jgi:hypothetical protein
MIDPSLRRDGATATGLPRLNNQRDVPHVGSTLRLRGWPRVDRNRLPSCGPFIFPTLREKTNRYTSWQKDNDLDSPRG